MKFAHLLAGFSAESETNADAFLDYKRLKKQLKKAFKPAKKPDDPPSEGDDADGAEEAASTQGQANPEVLIEEEKEFIRMLNLDLDRINDFFMNREEEAIIKLGALEERLAAALQRQAAADQPAAASKAELAALKASLVDFHGEAVLLLHWSLINYSGVVKILKKHDKLTGAGLRAPYLQNVLHQPFLSTESISLLVRRAEERVKQMSPGGGCGDGGGDGDGPGAAGEGEDGEAQTAMFRRTQAALGMLQELQRGAHTPSTLVAPQPDPAAAQEAKRRRVEPQPGEQQQQQQQGGEQQA